MREEFGGYHQSEIDYKVNRYTLRCLVFTLASTAVIWIANVCDIFIVNNELLSTGFSIATIIIVLTLMMGRIVDLHKPWVKYILLFNTTLAITVDGATLSYHAVLLSVLPLLLATQYTSKKVLVYTYILSILSTFASVMGGYFWGLCDANMLLLTVEKTEYYINQANGMVQIDISNFNPWYTLPLYYVVPRSIILLCLLPVIQSISRNIMGYAEYAVSMKQLSEKDEMTGLYNKNKYLKMMEKTYPKLESVGVIFWDVNNLKVINDTMGHAQGDYIITLVSGMIKELTDSRKRAYRIGGDEFVMVIENPNKGELDEVIRRWGEILEQRKTFSKIEISVAMGVAWGSGKDIADVEKQADEAMYQQKKRHHAHNPLFDEKEWTGNEVQGGH